MWMTDYIRAVKRAFRDQHGFTPDGGTATDPTFKDIPDGPYPMTIDGKSERIQVIRGKIYLAGSGKSEE